MQERIETESIDAYMNDISGYDRITPAEENELSRLMREGTPQERQYARDRLITTNLRLVVKIAHDFKMYGVGMADLVAEGNVGLMTAASKFEPGHGAKFSCYAAWWIKQAMRKAIAWQSRTIRIPGGSAQKLVHINKAMARLFAENGREPSIEEIAEATGYSIITVGGLLSSATETYSMSETISEDSATTFESSLAETREDETEERGKRLSALHDALARLTDLERMVVGTLYGIGEHLGSLREVALESGVPVQELKDKAPGILDQLRGLMAPAMA